jgi:hypothetical protein
MTMMLRQLKPERWSDEHVVRQMQVLLVDENVD